MDSLAYQYEETTELLNGQIVNMSPRPAVNHNIVAGNIYRIFGNFLKGKPRIAFSYGVDVYLTENDRVIPDIMVVCNKDIVKKNGVYGVPDLIVEVLSPSTAKNDKVYKKNLYQKCGVKEYWIVDADSCSIEVYLQSDNQYMIDDVYTMYPDYLLEKMTDEEKDKIVKEFKASLFSELIITIADVFEGTF